MYKYKSNQVPVENAIRSLTGHGSAGRGWPLRRWPWLAVDGLVEEPEAALGGEPEAELGGEVSLRPCSSRSHGDRDAVGLLPYRQEEAEVTDPTLQQAEAN